MYKYLDILFTIIKRWKQCKCLPTKGMDKQTVVYTYMEYYLSLKRKETDICYNIDEHYVRLNKPIAKRQILYVRCLDWSNS